MLCTCTKVKFFTFGQCCCRSTVEITDNMKIEPTKLLIHYTIKGSCEPTGEYKMLYISLAHISATLPYKKVSKCSQIEILNADMC